MSDRYAADSQTWHQCSAICRSVVSKHLQSLLDIDLKLLYKYIQTRELLDRGESNEVWDSTRPCHERIKKLIQFVCLKGVNHRNGLHGLEIFIECLRESGERYGHAGHTVLAQALTADLHIRPEEVVNAEEYEVRRKKEYAKLCMSIKKKFREILPEGSTEFEEFREFVSTYTTDEHMLAILNATTPDAVFIQLSVGKFITENDTRLLQTLLAEYGDETVSVDRQQLTWFDLRKGFVEFSLKIASRVAERSTAAQLKVSILSTPVKFGCYYKMLESEQNVSTMIKILRDWEHPELLHRTVRHFCSEEREWIDRYRANTATVPTSKYKSIEKEHLSHHESYADLLADICCFLEATPQNAANFLRWVSSLRLTTACTGLKLITDLYNTVCDALLALLPFSSYSNTYLIRCAVNNYCDKTLQDRLLANLRRWEDFIAHTNIADIYDVQLDCLPLQLTARGIAVLVLHLEGEKWKNPNIKLATDLALAMSEAFHLQPWSVVYYRTVLTGQETDRKSDCRVEFLVPAMAACIVMKDGASVRDFFHEYPSLTWN